jgi:hypothetical protein
MLYIKGVSMVKICLFIFSIVTAVVIVGSVDQNNPAQAADIVVHHTKGYKIWSALSAGPRSIRDGATVLDWPADMNSPFPVLRQGSNNWTCFPDDPHSPGKDPICADQQSLLWFQAYMTGATPHITQPGVAYMLRGGSEASNTDPFATEPPAGQGWMNSPPHIMIFPVGALDTSIYGTDMDAGGPWVMWANTPFQHLMIPVKQR